MRIMKDNIKDDDKHIALRVMNKLKAGNRVFGNPGEGLMKSLKKLEEDHKSSLKNKDKLQFLDNDGEYRDQCKKLKAGINGEKTLAEYFEKIIKYDDILQDVVVFASLSDPSQSASLEEDGYISDSDFIAVYGNHLLILDAKNIRTSPELPIYLSGNELLSVGGSPIMELHPSVHIWKGIMQRLGVPYLSIHGCVVIINQTGALIWKNNEWYPSEVKPIHISDLVEFMHDWVEDKEPETSLSLLTALSKMQIKKDGSEATESIRNNMKRFGV